MGGSYPIDPRIAYWTKGEGERNFGDYLSEYLTRRLLLGPLFAADIYRLIGSAIDEDVIARDLDALDGGDGVIAFWGCGARDERGLSARTRKRAVFFGVRGPLTRDLLRLPADTPLGDPGLLLPLAYQPRRAALSGGRICVPHFSQRRQWSVPPAGCDAVMEPVVASDADVEAFIDAIASAEFVLAGALHAAIVACAYGVPFAYWDPGEVDIPFKWRDFAASLGVDAPFVSNVEEGRAAFKSLSPLIVLPDLAAILGCCPFAVRPSVQVAALTRSVGLPETAADALKARAAALYQSRDEAAAAFVGSQVRSLSEAVELRRPQRAAARRYMANELQRLGQDMRELAESFARRAEGAALDLDPASGPITFSAGSPGVLLLEGAWTTPSEIAPWTLPPTSTIRLPAGSGWEMARAFVLEGFVYVPRTPPADGSRVLRVWVNGVSVGERPIHNAGPGHDVLMDFEFPIPDVARSAFTDLLLTVALTAVPSHAALGLGSEERGIGLAPLSLRFVFDDEGSQPPVSD